MSTTLRDDVTPVRLLVAGEVDLVTAEQFRAALIAAITRHQRVIVDLTAVEFLGSIGIGILYAHAHHLIAILVKADTIISRAITIAGLDLLVTVLPDPLRQGTHETRAPSGPDS